MVLSIWLLAIAVALPAALVGSEEVRMWDKSSPLSQVDGEPLIARQQAAIFSVGDLKAKIQGRDGTPRTKLHLFLEGRELADNEPLGSLGSLVGLKLVSDLHQVHVSLPSGETITFQVEPGDSVASVKHRISARGEAQFDSIDAQILKFEGAELEDSKRLEDVVGLENWSVLSLQKRNLVHSTVDGGVRVRLPSGEFASFRVPATLTVGAFKEFVRREKELAQGALSLSLKGSELADESLLLSYAPESRETPLLLTGAPVGGHIEKTISVQLESGKLITLEMEPTETVASLKARISWSEGIAGERQHLFHNHRELANNKLLINCVPDSKRTLQLTVCAFAGQGKHVHVLVNNSLAVFEFQLEDTLERLKEIIRRELNVAPEQSVQLYNSRGVELQAPGKLLIEQVLEDGAYLEARAVSRSDEFLIHVQFPTGGSLAFQARPSDTIASIKQRIQEERGIGIDRQKLYTSELNDHETLRNRNIESGSTVFLALAP